MTGGSELAAGLGSLVERFDHVSMAVSNLDDTVPFVALINGEPFDGGLSPRGDFRWAQYRLPGGQTLEMIASVDSSDEDHFINRFIAERGEGLHHVTLKVSDIRASVAAAEGLGFTVVGFDDSDPSWKEAFVHPKSAHGILVQLAEFPDDAH